MAPSVLKQPLSLKPPVRWILIAAVAASLGTSAVGVYSVMQEAKAKQEKALVPVVTAPVKPIVTALGRLEPQGEVIKLSAASSIEGARLAQLLVKQGDKVTPNQVVAILDNRDRLEASLEEAKKRVQVSQANLAKVKAGAKGGEIGAQQAEISRLQAQLSGESNTQKATYARLLAQLDGERKTQQATVARWQAQLEGERKAQRATILRQQAQLRNAELEFKRNEQLYQQGAIAASRFDTKRLELETAREQVNEAKAGLSRIETTLQQQIEEAKENLSRTEATLQQQLNEARATRNQTVETLQEQIKQAKATLNQISEVRPTDVLAAEAEIASAVAAVKKAQAELDQAYVRSPVAGQILKVNTRVGERISDDGIVELGQTDQMVAVAEVYESDVSKVRLGMPAAIASETNAFAGEITGTVNEIGLQIGKRDILNTDPAADVDARVVEVKIILDAASSNRVSNLTNSKVLVKIEL